MTNAEKKPKKDEKVVRLVKDITKEVVESASHKTPLKQETITTASTPSGVPSNAFKVKKELDLIPNDKPMLKNHINGSVRHFHAGESVPAVFANLRETRSPLGSLASEEFVLSNTESDKVYTLKDFDKEESGLFVLGLKLTPISTGVERVKDKGLLTLQEGMGASWFNYRVSVHEIPVGTLFDIYQFKIAGKQYTFALTSGSKVWLDKDVTDRMATYWFKSKHNITHDQGAGVVVYNATVINCSLFNSVVLKGGRYEECLISSSHIDCTKLESAESDLPWGNGGSRGYPNRTYTGCYFESSYVYRSDIPHGVYYQANLRDSQIESKCHVRLQETKLDQAVIRAPDRVSMNRTTLEKYTIVASHGVEIANQTLRDGYIRVDSIFAPNKLAISSFELPYGSGYNPIRLIRRDERHLELSGGCTGEKLKFLLSKTQWELRNEIDAWLAKALNPSESYREEGDPQPQGPKDVLSQSVLRYMSDSIISRIEIISTMDTTVSMARDLQPGGSTDNFGMYF